MKKYVTGLYVMAFLLCLSCVKDQGNLIPDVPVNFSAPINDPRLLPLQSAGGVVVLSNFGYAGLIIYRRPDGGYVAFDRCSSVNPQQKCRVDIDDLNITATDPCSGAKFLLSDGSPAKAPAQRPLKQYQVTVSSTNISVTN